MKYLSPSIFIFMIAPTIALAAGIQVSPSRLEFSLNSGAQQSKDIVVANPTANVQLFEISADDFQNAISINPESFTLEAGARKTVSITVNPKSLPQNQSQLFGTNLSVVSQPLANSSLGVGAGVKLPFVISFSPAPKNNPAPLIVYKTAALVFVLLITIWFIKKRRLK
jgi:P pilus assembly chaperone PapD